VLRAAGGDDASLMYNWASAARLQPRLVPMQIHISWKTLLAGLIVVLALALLVRTTVVLLAPDPVPGPVADAATTAPAVAPTDTGEALGPTPTLSTDLPAAPTPTLAAELTPTGTATLAPTLTSTIAAVASPEATAPPVSPPPASRRPCLRRL
jgi:hypothetical protein